MSQFVVFSNPDKATSRTYPYFLDVQNSLLEQLNTRVVIPFSALTSLKQKKAEKLCPMFWIDDKEHVLLTHQITAVPKSMLKKEVVDLTPFRIEILSAIDVLITGI